MSAEDLTRTVEPGQDYPLGPAALAALWRMEERHFWHRARNRWILQALSRHGLPAGTTFLEVGCGSGTVSGALSKAGYLVTGVDTSAVQIAKAKERFPAVRFFLTEVAALDPQRHGSFRGVGLFDVLEHVDDPAALLVESLRLATPGALVVATVPAHQSMYTAVDAVSGHKRRFEPTELTRLMRSCGLMRVEESGIFRFTARLQRMARRHLGAVPNAPLSTEEAERILIETFKVPPWPFNQLLALVCRLEAGRGDSRAGASIIATGYKPP